LKKLETNQAGSGKCVATARWIGIDNNDVTEIVELLAQMTAKVFEMQVWYRTGGPYKVEWQQTLRQRFVGFLKDFALLFANAACMKVRNRDLLRLIRLRNRPSVRKSSVACFGFVLIRQLRRPGKTIFRNKQRSETCSSRITNMTKSMALDSRHMNELPNSTEAFD
jgi:hypothetical protein